MSRRNGRAPQRKIGTFLIHGHRKTRRWDYSHHIVPPLSSSVAYRLGSAARGAKGFAAFGSAAGDPEKVQPIYIYDRLDEPDRSLLEDLLAHAEHGDRGVCFSTGMAAIAAVFGVFAKAGDEVVCHRVVYGSTYSLLTQWLPRFGVRIRFVDVGHPEALDRAITSKTRLVYCETPCNPTMKLIDIHQVAQVSHHGHRRSRVKVVVDNTFATPFGQRPLEWGADVVVHSLTKGISGFGTDMGGVVVTPKKYWSALVGYRKDFGGVLASKSAWPILVYGIPTLALRFRRQQETATIVASMLAEHPAVKEVRYPGLPSFPQYELASRQMVDEDGRFAPGTMIYFLLKGTRRDALRLLDRLGRSYTVTLAVSLGQIRTLVECPALMTHSSMPPSRRKQFGVDETGIRLSIGLEEASDLIRDLEAALR